MANKEHLYKAVQALIKEDSENAAIALHAYLTEKIREHLKGSEDDEEKAKELISKVKKGERETEVEDNEEDAKKIVAKVKKGEKVTE